MCLYTVFLTAAHSQPCNQVHATFTRLKDLFSDSSGFYGAHLTFQHEEGERNSCSTCRNETQTPQSLSIDIHVNPVSVMLLLDESRSDIHKSYGT